MRLKSKVIIMFKIQEEANQISMLHSKNRIVKGKMYPDLFIFSPIF